MARRFEEVKAAVAASLRAGSTATLVARLRREHAGFFRRSVRWEEFARAYIADAMAEVFAEEQGELARPPARRPRSRGRARVRSPPELSPARAALGGALGSAAGAARVAWRWGRGGGAPRQVASPPPPYCCPYPCPYCTLTRRAPRQVAPGYLRRGEAGGALRWGGAPAGGPELAREGAAEGALALAQRARALAPRRGAGAAARGAAERASPRGPGGSGGGGFSEMAAAVGFDSEGEGEGGGAAAPARDRAGRGRARRRGARRRGGGARGAAGDAARARVAPRVAHDSVGGWLRASFVACRYAVLCIECLLVGTGRARRAEERACPKALCARGAAQSDAPQSTKSVNSR